MSIISASDFIGEYSIPNRSEMATAELIEGFVSKYEPQLLTELLGADLYSLLNAGPDTLQKWIDLTNQVKVSIICYVYYYFRRNQATSFSGTGEIVNNNENSTVVSPVVKMVDRWNEMVKNNHATVKFINDHQDDYGAYYSPEWIAGWNDWRSRFIPDIFRVQNTLNI